MKTCLFLFALSACCNNGFAQRAVVAASMMNVVYLGVDNPLEIMLEGCACEDVLVVPESGRIFQTDACGHYEYIPEKLGDVTFRINCKSGAKRDVHSKKFRVQFPRLPVASLRHRSGGEITVRDLQDAKGIDLVIKYTDIDPPFKVHRYDVALFHGKDAAPLTLANDQALFSKPIIDLLRGATGGDLVIIRNMEIVGPGGFVYYIDPMIFEVRL